MNKMTYTHYVEGKAFEVPVLLLAAYYRPGDGPRALVIGADNIVFEASPNDLKLGTKEYNRAFSE